MPASSTMSKESASYDMAEFDQSAIFLYLDGHDQEQRQTLNIFPSQPMHVAEPIPAKDVSVGMVAAMPNGNSSPPKRQEQGGQRSPAVPPPAPTVALLTSAKETKSSLTKKEATNGGKGATSGDQERVRDPKVTVSVTLSLILGFCYNSSKVVSSRVKSHILHTTLQCYTNF